MKRKLDEAGSHNEPDPKRRRVAAEANEEVKEVKAVEAVRFYRPWEKPYGVFSNYHDKSPIVVDGVKYASSEHYYHECKFSDAWFREQIRNAATPHISREIAHQEIKSKRNEPWRPAVDAIITESHARGVKMHKDWDKRKDAVMRKAVLAKFRQHVSLKKLLLGTGSAEIIEASPYDWYWGEGKNGTGKNKLGVILMQARDKLRGEEEAAKASEPES